MLSLPLKYETDKAGFVISTDKSRIDVAAVHEMLNRSYWAEGIPRDILESSIENSICFGVYEGKKQVGFSRVISDLATFGYLADVVILEPYRGRGLSKQLVSFIMACPAFQKLRRWTLITRDAQGLYAQFGFEQVAKPEQFMERVVRNPYKK